MPVTAGIDLMRGRPTPAIGTTEAKLQQRKLDALRRGVHRVANPESLPYGVHVIGIGGAGTSVVERMLRDAPADLLATDGSRLSALAIDIGTGSLAGVDALGSKFATDRAQIETLALAMPQADALAQTLQHYRGFLELEYPLLQGSTAFESWIDAAQPLPVAGEPVPRALAKAVYGQAYYDSKRPMAAALKRFAASTNATQGDAVVCIVFGLGGGTGSGMALDLARHLSTGLFGRRVLVMGIGIAPCEGDLPVHRGGAVFPVLNELDSLCDEAQNRGVVQACGELYKNPFTAGFLLVPQQPAFVQARDLAATHARVDGELAALLTQRHGANLWEVLRLLNWVAAPSTQHSAARTPWGAKWMHVLGFDDATRAPAIAVPAMAAGLGLLPGYAPEFIELRVAESSDGAQAWAAALDATFAPDAAATVAAGGAAGSVQFVLPRAAKTDLELFFAAREAYDRLTPTERVASHALLLERGVVLSEPSTRIEGMAGAGLNGSDAWVGVPLEAMRGPAVEPAAEVRHAA
jgi:Tubulin like